MYLFTRKFWNDLRLDPREAVDSLKNQKSRFWYQCIKCILFLRIVFAEYAINHCITRASALAFALLLTLIPLVVTAALMLAGLVDVQPKQVENFFGTLLPFAPETVLNYISTFYMNARSLRGWSLAIFIVVAIGLFGVAEESFNTIWKVVRQRSFFARLRSFTMVMVYSPILFALSFFLRHSKWIDLAANHFYPIDILPFLLMALAFTSLIWLLPNTRVSFKSALIGGLTAAVLFEAERRGFGMYVKMSIHMQTIYGTLGIMPLFLLSLFVVCLFVLFGAEIAYVLQNFRPLLRAQKRWDRRVSDYKTYLTFRMFIDAVAAFSRKHPPPNLAFFTKRYELTEPQACGILNWLVHAKFLHSTGGGDAYVPTRDFSKVPISEVLNEIQAQDLRITAIPDDYTREFVTSLFNNNRLAVRTPAEQITFEDMIRNCEEGEKKFSAVSALM